MILSVLHLFDKIILINVFFFRDVCIAIDFPVMVGVLLWVPAYVAALVLFGLVPKSRGRGGSSSYSSSSYSDDGEEG